MGKSKKQLESEPFAEAITFSGRSEQFVIANDTFVSASLYEQSTELREGSIVRGLRVLGNDGKASKWRCVQIDAIDSPPVQEKRGMGRGGRGGRGGGSSAGGLPFSELVTYAGRSDVFAIAGRETYVPAGLYAAWRPVYEGDRLEGSRVPNSGGSSKWRAVTVRSVQRAEAPALSAHDSWLESSQELLARIERERQAARHVGEDHLE